MKAPRAVILSGLDYPLPFKTLSMGEGPAKYFAPVRGDDREAMIRVSFPFIHHQSPANNDAEFMIKG